MSLTYDALQKAAKEKQRKTVVTPQKTVTPARTAEPAPQQSVRLPPRYSPGTLILFAAILTLVLVLIVGYALYGGKQGSSQVPSPVEPRVAPSAQQEPRAPTPEPPAPPPLTADPRFRVTGIMKDPDGKFAAVLNGRVVYEGYVVDGANVKRIERDRVTLDVAGRDLVLRLF